jgi:LemA protein
MGIAALVIVGLVLLAIILYNGLAQLRVRADSAWSDINVQLKRRHDLIPNLVETVKGYAAHEKGTFENIARYRSAAMSATTPAEKSQAEGQLTQALRGLLAVAENYPQLQASQQFTSLQGSLSEIEDAIQNSRRYYNAVVRDLNTKVVTFPSNIVAGMFGFQQRQFFELETPEDKQVPAVKF